MLLLSRNSHRWWIWSQCNLSDPFPAMSVHGGLLTAPGGASKPKGIQGGALSMRGGALSMRAQSPKIRPRLDCPVVAWAVRLGRLVLHPLAAVSARPRYLSTIHDLCLWHFTFHQQVAGTARPVLPSHRRHDRLITRRCHARYFCHFSPFGLRQGGS